MDGNLTFSQADELFSYDPDTGLVTRKVDRQSFRAGTVVGSKHYERDGQYYLTVYALKKHYQLHRVIWLLMTKKWPDGQIDHINMVKSDNRWCNLRCATHAQNLYNRPAPKTSRSGVKGVYFNGAKWVARLCLGGTKVRHIGTYSSVEDARRAYEAAYRGRCGEFART